VRELAMKNGEIKEKEIWRIRRRNKKRSVLRLIPI